MEPEDFTSHNPFIGPDGPHRVLRITADNGQEIVFDTGWHEKNLDKPIHFELIWDADGSLMWSWGLGYSDAIPPKVREYIAEEERTGNHQSAILSPEGEVEVEIDKIEIVDDDDS